MSSHRLTLRLDDVSFDTDRDEIRWTWWLRDDRLPEGETFLHVATNRCGWGIRCGHSVIDGLCWFEVDDMDGEGLPIADDGELKLRLMMAIRAELARVDLARLLLIHYPPSAKQAA